MLISPKGPVVCGRGNYPVGKKLQTFVKLKVQVILWFMCYKLPSHISA